VADLAAFDDERLCRALRASRTPVIAAVGHTDNDPVCNAVTHSAHVPRHAAEHAVPDRRALIRELEGTGLVLDRAGARAAAELAGVATTLDEFAELGSRRVAGAAERRSEVGLLGSALSRAGNRELSAFATTRRESLERCAEAMGGGSGRCLGRAREELERGRRAVALSGARQGAGLGQRGQALLARFAASDFSRRGWVLASDARGQSVTSVERVRVGERLRLRVADGEVAVLVEAVTPR
jgi:exodeoxyribonuclease VII large subunit